MHPWFTRLVFDDEFEVRVFTGEPAHAVERILPERTVIHLEGIIPAILPRP